LELETDLDHDLELERRVRSFLDDAHMPGLRHLTVVVRNGVVTLSGQVRTYYERQLGCMRTRRVAGVVKLVDRINVAS
jgi:osmotically-inducible protein OsmY